MILRKHICMALSALILMACLLTGCSKDEETADMTAEVSENGEPTETAREIIVSKIGTIETEPAPQSVKIIAIGDMLMHKGVSDRAFQADGSVNYSYLFTPIADELASADISVLNNEVIFGGNELGLMGYPQFNVYTELGDAEKAAGFNVILNASNHTMDQGAQGVYNTLNFWKKYPDVLTLGIHDSQEDQDAIDIIEVNGIRIAMFNFTYGLNYETVSPDTPWLIDLMKEERKGYIANALMRAEELADFTIVFPHWGSEYALRHNAEQEDWAYFFTYYGADLIIGSHSHCLEDRQEFFVDNGTHSVCYYSLGNYVGLQDHTVCQLGGLLEIELTKTSAGTVISGQNMRFLVNHYYSAYVGPYTYYLENYSDELAAQHGVNVDNLPDSYGFKPNYPLSLQGFQNILTTTGLR